MKQGTNLQIVLLIVFTMTIPAIAGNSLEANWEFTGDQQPHYELLWPIDAKVNEVGCSRWVDLLYENYAKIHPKFRSMMSNQLLRKKWRKSLVRYGDGGVDSINYCIYRMLSRRIFSLPFEQKQTAVFCGIKAHGLHGKQQIAAEAAEELTYYAILGKFSAIHTVLNHEQRLSPAKFNLDVKYYLQQMINHVSPPGDSLRDVVERYMSPDAGKALSPERRKFVDEAFRRRDYKAVLATTTPCKP